MGCHLYRVCLEFSPPPTASLTRVFLYRMGTTAKSAGSQENFTKIDKEYVEAFPLPSSLQTPFLPSYFPLTSASVPAHIFFFSLRYVVNAAKAAKADKDQRLIYVSVRSSFHLWASSHVFSYVPCRCPRPTPSHRYSTRAVRL